MTESYELYAPPKYVGGYRIGQSGNSYFQICLTKKPNVIHRYFMKLLLGWRWVNKV